MQMILLAARAGKQWGAWAILALGLALLGGMLVLQALGCGALVDFRSSSPAEALAEVTVVLTGLAFLALGAFITRARRENRIGWLCGLTGLSLIAMSFTIEYPGCGFAGGPWAAWAANDLMLLSLYLMFILLPLWFPDGQYLSKAWQRLAAATAGLLGCLAIIAAVWPGALLIVDSLGGGAYPNPAGLPFVPPPALDAALRQAPSLIVIAAAIAANASLFARWRHSSGETRQQMKWLAFFILTASTLFLLLEGIGGLFFPGLLNGWLYLIALTVTWLGYPVVIGIAVLKYRLYDIDLIIRRTLLYSSLTAVLALLYGLIVILLQLLIQALNPQNSPTQLEIVLTTLVIAGLFNPIRRRLQTLIDRRFYRYQVDRQRILSQMGKDLQNEVDIGRLNGIVLKSVEDALQPENLSLWMRNRRMT